MSRVRAAVAALVVTSITLVLGGCVSDDDKYVDAGGGDASADPSIVVTQSGPVKGVVESNYRAFLRIPYAAPPIGDLRWKPPEAPAPWTDPYDATKYGPSCWQPEISLIGLINFDESCLSLAVWTPSPAPKKAAVMVFIHGGAFVAGGLALPGSSGKQIAAKHGVVVVSMNYRLGPLGALAHAALGNGPGNFGLLDQQAALRWVRDNIAAFGGDPGNVTIFGESAGSISVCLHLVSPKSTGLFQRAIMESGSCIEAVTRADAEAYGKKVSAAVGCDKAGDEAACLRGKSAKELALALPVKLEALFSADLLWPFVDGDTLLESPPATLASGKLNAVPVLLGTNANEGTLFLNTDAQRAMDAAAYRQMLDDTLGSDAAAKVYAQYDPASYSAPVEAMAEVLTDGLFACPTRRTARAVAAADKAAYLYQFVYTPSHFAAYPFLRASHTAELPFVFGIPALGFFPAKEKPLVDIVMGYWTRFAKTGDPNGDGATVWPRYDASSGKYLEINLTPKQGSALKKAACDFWQTIPLL